MAYLLRISFLFFCLPLLAWGVDYTAELNERYAPYADWAARIDPDALSSSEQSAWWRSPEVIRMQREKAALPLSGLHLALDPGHIGGAWAEVEGRHFKMAPGDLPVREGELVLEVAKLVEKAVTEMGGRVSMLRQANRPLNRRPPEAYFEAAVARVPLPEAFTWAAFKDYGERLRREMRQMSAVAGELQERARLVNEVVRPDALISLHINAAPWPVQKDGSIKYAFVSSNHSHALIFGCLSEAELSKPRQEEQLRLKLSNGSGPIERELGQALGVSLAEWTGLPASVYGRRIAVRLSGSTPYLWARNLLLLRSVQCPVVLLEPYIANNGDTYARIQQALRDRQRKLTLAEEDILQEYANAVVEGLLVVYGPKQN